MFLDRCTLCYEEKTYHGNFSSKVSRRALGTGFWYQAINRLCPLQYESRDGRCPSSIFAVALIVYRGIRGLCWWFNWGEIRLDSLVSGGSGFKEIRVTLNVYRHLIYFTKVSSSVYRLLGKLADMTVKLSYYLPNGLTRSPKQNLSAPHTFKSYMPTSCQYGARCLIDLPLPSKKVDLVNR